MVPKRSLSVFCSTLVVSFLWGQPLAAQFVPQGVKLVASDAVGNAFLGNAVALSRDASTALVGGYDDDGSIGAAWVFVRATNGTWSQQQKLVASNAVGTANQGFAAAISADGNTALVGGPADDSGAGAAWIWVRSGATWTEQAKLVAPDAVGGAFTGGAVSLSGDGNTAAIGGKDDTGGTGAVWIWVRSGTSWTKQAKLVGTPAAGGDLQGSAVGLSADGQSVVIGAPGADAAWVFTRSGSVWTQSAKLVALDAVGSARQGGAVALSDAGDTAIVSGSMDDGGKGAAWIWAYSGGSWSKQAKLVGSGAVGAAEQGFTASLAADGNTAIMGSVLDDGSIGAAWIWGRSGSVWTQAGGKLVGSGRVGSSSQGVVALSGDGTTALVGGWGDDGNKGAAWAWGAAALRFVQQPVDTPVGQTITPAVTVQLYAGTGGPAAQGGVSVTLSLGSGTGSLSGTPSQLTDAAGLATFNDLALDLAGPKKLIAAGSGYLPAVSSPFAGTCASPPTAAASGSATICQGMTTPLTGSGGVSCSWSPATGLSDPGSCAPSASPSVTTTYTLTVKDGADCPSVNSPTVTVTVSGVAPSAVVTAPASAAPNETGLVASVPDAGFGATYAWTITNGTPVSGQNARVFTFTAGSGGFVGLVVTVMTGPTCSASGSAAVAVGNAAANSITFTHLAGTPGGPGAVDANGTASRFAGPTAVAFDGAGNLYVADGANTIRKISTSGDVTTLAGLAGNRGSADGTGSSARFFYPRGLALDGAGNLYVSDHFNHTIRKVTPAGVVSTYLGLAGSYGSVGGIGSAARLHYPAGLAVDLSRNVLYVAERGSHVIRRVDLATGEIFPYAGLAGSYGNANGTGTTARFFAPLGLAIDGSGTLYVSDSLNYAIRKVTRAGAPAGSEGDVTTLASGFVFPDGLVADGLGNLYLADFGDRRIKKIVVSTGAVSPVAGQLGVQGTEDGAGSSARFFGPTGIALDSSGNAWVADYTSIRRVALNPPNVVATVYGAPAAFGLANGTGSAARFYYPRGIAADKNGNAWVADWYNHSIRKVTPAGLVSTFAGPSDGLLNPMGVAVDSAGNVYVADTSNSVIRKITSGGSGSILAGLVGNPGSDDGPPTVARFNFPRGVAVDAAGYVYVADTENSKIRKITPQGNVSTLGSGFAQPAAVAVDGPGNVFVADSGNCVIRKIDTAGALTTLAGSVGSCGYGDGPGGAARFYNPVGITLDANGNVYVTEINDNRIRKITQAGVVSTIVYPQVGMAGSEDGTDNAARFASPEGIAVDPLGNLIVSDTGNHAIRIGRPALAAAATIDSATGSVGVVRNLGSTAAATTYAWEVIRRPSGSTAALSSTSSRTPTFTPDIADLYVFRLTASDGANTSITLVSLTASSGGGCTPPPAPAITAPAIVGADSPNRTASVANHGGSTYAWSVTNGTITAGQGTSQITFRSGAPGTLVLTVVETNGGCSSPQATANVTVAPAGQALLFYPLYPCRMYSTPGGSGAPLASGEIRTIAPAGACGIPASAKALAANATVVGPGATGHLVVWPAGTAMPVTSNLNFNGGRARSNNVIVTMPGTAATGFSIFNGSAGTTPLIIDVSGYFE